MKPNILIIDDFVKQPSELFYKVFNETDWNEKFYNRKTASYGVNYRYNGISYDEIAIPSYLQELAKQINYHLGFLPNNCLINYYDNGQSKMGFHVDDVSQMAEATGVAIISLGETRHITYRLIEDKKVKVDYALCSGSLLYMNDEVQTAWQHAILADNTTQARISLTFRQLI